MHVLGGVCTKASVFQAIVLLSSCLQPGRHVDLQLHALEGCITVITYVVVGVSQHLILCVLMFVCAPILLHLCLFAYVLLCTRPPTCTLHRCLAMRAPQVLSSLANQIMVVLLGCMQAGAAEIVATKAATVAEELLIKHEYALGGWCLLAYLSNVAKGVGLPTRTRAEFRIRPRS